MLIYRETLITHYENIQVSIIIIYIYIRTIAGECQLVAPCAAASVASRTDRSTRLAAWSASVVANLSQPTVSVRMPGPQTSIRELCAWYINFVAVGYLIINSNITYYMQLETINI